jgi:hypothetical protein
LGKYLDHRLVEDTKITWLLDNQTLTALITAEGDKSLASLATNLPQLMVAAR